MQNVVAWAYWCSSVFLGATFKVFHSLGLNHLWEHFSLSYLIWEEEHALGNIHYEVLAGRAQKSAFSAMAPVPLGISLPPPPIPKIILAPFLLAFSKDL